MLNYRLVSFFVFLSVFSASVYTAYSSEGVPRTVHRGISYYDAAVLEKADDYQKSQCVLDIAAPKDGKDLPVLVWFHGGGLTAGTKEIPKLLLNKPVVLVGVGYRLAPKVTFPAFLEDGAAAVAWTFKNIEQYNGSPKKIFIGGCSAGGYISGMLGLDPRWLKPYQIERSQIAGLCLLTGQMTTHFHVRKLLNYPQPEYLPAIDENAPMFYLSKDAPPVICEVGEKALDMPARAEENEFMIASLRAMKHPHIEFYENKGYNHGKMGNCPEAFERFARFIEKYKDGTAGTKK
jgi:acetyl esterase/lipase